VGATAADRGPQTPSVAAPALVEQAWQSVVEPPPQALLQQTPSTQKLLTHCEPIEHGAPLGSPALEKLSAIATSAAESPDVASPIKSSSASARVAAVIRLAAWTPNIMSAPWLFAANVTAL
jgi:hypothetical protein